MSQKIRIKLKSYDHNLVDKSAEENRKDGKEYGRRSKRSDSFAYAKEDLHCAAFAAREQEVS